MADQNKKSSFSLHEKQGFLHFLKNLLFKKKASQQLGQNEKNRLEPKYWPEVIELKATLEKLVSSHTLEDENVHHVNDQILSHIQNEINKKGAIEDLEARYTALETLADRILTTRIAGLKQTESAQAEFTNAIVAFKKRLSERYKQELAMDLSSSKPKSPNI